MNKLIINADDFGYTRGINKGIIEAHQKGIVTSTSVMIDYGAADEVTTLRKFSNLAVGLHFIPSPVAEIETELERQFTKFVSMTGERPTHIDIHKVKKEDAELKQAVITFAGRKGVHARYSGEAKFIDSFFGPHSGGDGSITSLKNAIDEATDEINELMCHVGHADDELRNTSSYNDLRQLELESICSGAIKDYVAEKDIELANWSTLDVSTAGT